MISETFAITAQQQRQPLPVGGVFAGFDLNQLLSFIFNIILLVVVIGAVGKLIVKR